MLDRARILQLSEDMEEVPELSAEQAAALTRLLIPTVEMDRWFSVDSTLSGQLVI